MLQVLQLLQPCYSYYSLLPTTGYHMCPTVQYVPPYIKYLPRRVQTRCMSCALAHVWFLDLKKLFGILKRFSDLKKFSGFLTKIFPFEQTFGDFEKILGFEKLFGILEKDFRFEKVFGILKKIFGFEKVFGILKKDYPIRKTFLDLKKIDWFGKNSGQGFDKFI